MYPSDLKYTKDHEWVRIDGTTGTVGITHFAQQQLGDVTVTEVNTALKDRPDAVNSQPHESWMIKVTLSNAGDADALLDSSAYEALTH